jgi:two-component system sensor histidine kinase/response regulator
MHRLYIKTGKTMDTLQVLAIDDEPGMRRGVVKTLKRFTMTQRDLDTEVMFEVTEVENGKDALEALATEKFDIVLLDYKLPDINGIEILNNIREKEYDLLTIMMTAYASLEVAVSATKNGAFDFLAKPFSPDELKAVVRKAASNLMLKRHAKQLAEEKKQVRFQFLSVLAHELKAPLNAIEGYLDIMDNRIAGDNIEKYDKMVKRSLVRINGMRKLIFDLLDLTRIESGQKKRELQNCNILEAAINAIESMEPMADERDIKINLIPQEAVNIYGDNGEFEIIFNNLVSNAVKYNNDNGKVDIYITKEENIVTIKVADTGIGMNEEQQAKLFKEFVRFKNDKTRNIEGSGLGLSILKRISLLYDGEVTVESEENKGTTFIMTLKDETQ